MKFARYLEKCWHQTNVLSLALTPVSMVYGLAVWLRRSLFRLGLLRVRRWNVPVVVIGNLTVGGAGKTPLVIATVRALRNIGYYPGVVSRGYRRQSQCSVRATVDSNPDEVGDEPALIARLAGVPVAVDSNRPRAVDILLNDTSVDVIVSDDGLQHLRMGRSVEIAVIDDKRRFGNGRLLPAGPLREPKSRLGSVDMVVRNGGIASSEEFSMRLTLASARNLISDEERPLSDFSGSSATALAGIADPDNFFRQLRERGIDITGLPFPDHHRYSMSELEPLRGITVLMTAKDAVKCRRVADSDWWEVGQAIDIEPAFIEQLWKLVSGATLEH
ncbi:MAG: tetraacyldisaccharide 4'-kinase [Arenicellales bacterium]|jgi:tetraacyldisaccharide 4'-kinase|nr:tetraacyldisaccharide 4'-kinase [Arenicellales bacterium]